MNSVKFRRFQWLVVLFAVMAFTFSTANAQEDKSKSDVDLEKVWAKHGDVLPSL